MSWEMVKLAEICETTSGGTPSRAKNEFWENGNIPWIKSGQLKDSNIYEAEEFITPLGLKNSSAKLIPSGTLLLALYGATAGKLGFLEVEATINQAICALTPNQELLSNRYLFYYLLSKRGKIIEDSAGGAQPNISQKYVQNIEIPLPPLSTQQRIAEILDKADALRRKDQALLKKYDDLAQAIFMDMFGDPVKNEMGWEVKSVITNCDCIVPGRDKPKSFSGDIPWVTTDDLNHLGFTEVSKKKMGLTIDEVKEVKARLIPIESVIMTCVGDLGIISINKTEMVINQQLHAFQCKEGIKPMFLMYALSYQKDYMYKMASSTTVAYMNKTVCNSIPIICPPIESQIDFCQKIEELLKIKKIVQKEISHSENLFQSLLQQAFKGELV